jgi:hypothetical protein
MIIEASSVAMASTVAAVAEIASTANDSSACASVLNVAPIGHTSLVGDRVVFSRSYPPVANRHMPSPNDGTRVISVVVERKPAGALWRSHDETSLTARLLLLRSLCRKCELASDWPRALWEVHLHVVSYNHVATTFCVPKPLTRECRWPLFLRSRDGKTRVKTIITPLGL